MISPSNLERRMLCPGSEWAEAGRPDTSSPAALEGTRKHALLEKWARGVVNGSQAVYNPDDDPDVAWVRGELLPTILGTARAELMDAGVFPECNLSTELRHRLGMNRENDPNRCKADLVVLHGGGETPTIYDYKFGEDVADPSTDLQMISYAIGVRAKFGFTGSVNLVKMNGRHRQIIMATLTAEELDSYEIQIFEAVQKTYEESAPREAGANQCRYCKAKDSCPEFAKFQAELSSNPHIQPKLVNSVTEWIALSPMQRGAFLGALDASLSQYKILRDNIENHVLTEDFKGVAVVADGYKIGKGRGGREWRNEIEATAALTSLALGEKKDQSVIFEPQKLLSPAMAEKLFSGVTDKIMIASLVNPIPGKPKFLSSKK
jgi:hypothetical protein